MKNHKHDPHTKAQHLIAHDKLREILNILINIYDGDPQPIWKQIANAANENNACAVAIINGISSVCKCGTHEQLDALISSMNEGTYRTK